MIEGWRTKSNKPALRFGIGVHSALELYHRLRAKGEDHKAAQIQVARYCMTEYRDLWLMEDNSRTPFTLARAAIWYLEQFEHDPTETVILEDGSPAVELSFRVQLPETSPDGDPYLWCGHIDRLVRFQDSYMVSDVKTSKSTLDDRFFAKFSPDNQVTGYLFASQIFLKDEPVSDVMIDGVQVAVNFNRYKRAFIPRTPDQVDEWLGDTLAWIKAAERYAEQEYWPMNASSCDKFGGCPFRTVCSKSKEVRQSWLEGDYKQEPWNPLQSREA
jgi:hypothetical protein